MAGKYFSIPYLAKFVGEGTVPEYMPRIITKIDNVKYAKDVTELTNYSVAIVCNNHMSHIHWFTKINCPPWLF